MDDVQRLEELQWRAYRLVQDLPRPNKKISAAFDEPAEALSTEGCLNHTTGEPVTSSVVRKWYYQHLRVSDADEF